MLTYNSFWNNNITFKCKNIIKFKRFDEFSVTLFEVDEDFFIIHKDPTYTNFKVSKHWIDGWSIFRKFVNENISQCSEMNKKKPSTNNQFNIMN